MSNFIAIVSDTHGNIESTRDAIRQIEPFEPLAVLHCGDIGSAEVVRQFVSRPTYFVFGNVDVYNTIRAGRGDQKLRELLRAKRFGEITLLNQRIAWLHGDDSKLLPQRSKRRSVRFGLQRSYALSMICAAGKTTVLNPGLCSEQRRIRLPSSILHQWT